MSLPFCNNLKAGDIVELAGDGRRGRVVVQPRETSRTTKVQIDGLGPAYYPVVKLRLVIDGKAESVPPIDGEPDPTPAKQAPTAPTSGPPQPDEAPTGDVTLDQLFAMRTALREQLDRLDRHLLILQLEEMTAPRHLQERQRDPRSAINGVSADQAKIKADMAKALAAAKRLFPTTH